VWVGRSLLRRVHNPRNRQCGRREEDRMTGFLFRLETSEGVAADPSMLKSIVPNWKPGDSIYLDAGRCA